MVFYYAGIQFVTIYSRQEEAIPCLLTRTFNLGEGVSISNWWLKYDYYL